MSILKSNYEISIWQDIFEGGEIKEDKLCVIGAHDMTSPFRALKPQLKSLLNGSHTFTFSMHRFVTDPVTGEKEENPFIFQLVNETKIKVNKKGKWYDLFIKNIKQDSNNSTYTYTAEDVHISELSKLGYDVTLDDQMMNNLGTAEVLAKRILEVNEESGVGALGWAVDSETLPEYHEDWLIKCYAFIDMTPQVVYVFYSDCVAKPRHFQYLLFGREIGVSDLDADGVIRKVDSDYWYELPDSYTFIKIENSNSQFYGLWFPSGWTPSETTKYRADKKVYTQLSYYNPVLNKYVSKVTDGVNNYAEYTESEYITPKLIQNYISNYTFSTTSGWKGSALLAPLSQVPENFKDFFGKCKAVALDANGRELQEDYLLKGESTKNISFVRALEFGSEKTGTESLVRCLINTGFRDNRKTIENLSPGQKFVFLYRAFENSIAVQFNVGDLKYDQEKECYLDFVDNGSSSYFNFGPDQSIVVDGQTYKYQIGTVVDDFNMTEEEFLKSNLSIVIKVSGSNFVRFMDLGVYPYIPVSDTDSTPVLPILNNLGIEGKVVTNYRVYDEDAMKDVVDPKQYNYVYDNTEPHTFIPVETTQRVRSLSAKQSNYFNNIQALCEKFECWAEFDIQHDNEGYIKNKIVHIRRYVGQDNFVGIRYGINLKGVSRTLDSKSIISKLIVADNINEFAKNGFCSIGRAPMNFTGENAIYDFSYFINNDLLKKEDLEGILYGDVELLTQTEKRKEVWERIDINNINQYYSKLHLLNKEVSRQSEIVANFSSSLIKANADYQEVETGIKQAQEELIELAEEFRDIAQFSYQEITEDRRKIVENSTKLTGLIESISDLILTKQTYENREASVKDDKEKYEAQYARSCEILDEISKKKQALNALFVKTLGRYIQEGTWPGKDYIDDNKYFSDAQITLKDSALPKVSYTFSIIDVSGLEGYELYELNLGDKTWAEDPELFGYDFTGNPYREEITVTEMVENLDSPESNTIKVQNYKNQFQDLFQKITATTQQVQYNEGSWNKAANFTDASADTQAKFLQDALNSAELELSNQANPSIAIDKFGITSTNLVRPSEKLKITNGTIFFHDSDEEGAGIWYPAITSRGINAILITAGQINTNLVQVMSGDHPTFQWNQYGINAYSPKVGTDFDSGINRGRAVRFDHYGLYGFDINEENKEVTDFVPKNEAEIEEKAYFYLGWRGLFLRPGAGKYTQHLSDDGESNEFDLPKTHVSTARFGRADEYLYNTWDEFGKAYYDTDYEETAQSFVKIMSIKRGDQEQYALYDDGTVICKKLRAEGADISGRIVAEEGRIGTLHMAENGLHGKYYSSVEPNEYFYEYAGMVMLTNESEAALQGDAITFFAGATNKQGLNARYYVRNDGLTYSQAAVMGDFVIGGLRDQAGLSEQVHPAIYSKINNNLGIINEVKTNMPCILCPEGVEGQFALTYSNGQTLEINNAINLKVGNFIVSAQGLIYENKLISFVKSSQNTSQKTYETVVAEVNGAFRSTNLKYQIYIEQPFDNNNNLGTPVLKIRQL